MEEAARKKDEEVRAKVQRDIRAMKEEQGGWMDVDSNAVLTQCRWQLSITFILRQMRDSRTLFLK